jgi:4-hydroxybenzoyl-CoA thioesterase
MFTNRVRIRVEFGDCDPAQIVFYANYFRWFDNCTSALFRAAGLPLKELFQAHGVIGIPVVEAKGRYLIPSAYGDELIAESCASEFKRTSFVINHRFLRPEGLAMEGWETRVWAGPHPTEPHRMKGVPVPEEIIRILSAHRSRASSSSS